MDAYVFQADLYCPDCATQIRTELAESPEIHHLSEDDSDEYPQGPHANGGGEAGAPQHRGDCGTFLQNPLTRDGTRYVAKRILDALMEHAGGDPNAASGPAVLVWADFYDLGTVGARAQALGA